MDEEKWKDLIYYDYQISNYGNVRNKKSGKIMKQYCNNTVRLSKNGFEKAIPIDQLVAKYFLEPPDLPSIIVHIDDNRLNNHFSNLKWKIKNRFKNIVIKDII